MVRCRSTKCIDKQKEIVRKIMLTIPKEFRLDYEKVRAIANPFIQKKEWKDWVYENNR